MRITRETLRVLRVFCANPSSEHYGLETIKASGVQAGTLYPILIRLERNGWLESAWETIDEKAAGRPARRYYRLTETGLRDARAQVRDEDRLTASLQVRHA